MTDVVIRKWGVEHHPTVDPIPIAIRPYGANDTVVPLHKDSKFFEVATRLTEEHNALVDAFENLRFKYAICIAYAENLEEELLE